MTRKLGVDRAPDLTVDGNPAFLPQSVPIVVRPEGEAAIVVSVPVEWSAAREGKLAEGRINRGTINEKVRAEADKRDQLKRHGFVAKTEGEDLVPNAPLRREFSRLESAGEMTAKSVAEHMGWARAGRPGADGKRYPNSDRVLDTLGIKQRSDGTYRERMPYETAVQLCHAMNLDPTEVDL